MDSDSFYWRSRFGIRLDGCPTLFPNASLASVDGVVHMVLAGSMQLRFGLVGDSFDVGYVYMSCSCVVVDFRYASVVGIGVGLWVAEVDGNLACMCIHPPLIAQLYFSVGQNACFAYLLHVVAVRGGHLL